MSKKDPLEIVCNNIRSLRIAKGWNIMTVAELSGIPVEELVAIENGADCRLDYLRLLCDLYGIRMSSIFHPLTGFDMER